MLSRKELALFLNVTDRTIDNYRKKGMPFIQLPSGTIRFNKDEVLEWLRKEKENKENE